MFSYWKPWSVGGPYSNFFFGADPSLKIATRGDNLLKMLEIFETAKSVILYCLYKGGLKMKFEIKYNKTIWKSDSILNDQKCDLLCLQGPGIVMNTQPLFIKGCFQIHSIKIKSYKVVWMIHLLDWLMGSSLFAKKVETVANLSSGERYQSPVLQWSLVDSSKWLTFNLYLHSLYLVFTNNNQNMILSTLLWKWWLYNINRSIDQSCVLRRYLYFQLT